MVHKFISCCNNRHRYSLSSVLPISFFQISFFCFVSNMRSQFSFHPFLEVIHLVNIRSSNSPMFFKVRMSFSMFVPYLLQFHFRLLKAASSTQTDSFHRMNPLFFMLLGSHIFLLFRNWRYSLHFIETFIIILFLLASEWLQTFLPERNNTLGRKYNCARCWKFDFTKTRESISRNRSFKHLLEQIHMFFETNVRNSSVLRCFETNKWNKNPFIPTLFHK